MKKEIQRQTESKANFFFKLKFREDQRKTQRTEFQGRSVVMVIIMIVSW